MSLELSSNVQPDGYSYLNLSRSSQTLLAKTKTWVSDVLPLSFSVPCLFWERSYIFFSQLCIKSWYCLCFISLHTLRVRSLNGCSFEVARKTTISPDFLCQTSSCHTWIYARNSQLSFFTSVSPKLVNSKKKKKKEFLNPIFTPNKNFMALNFWSYFMSNTLCLVYKTPVSLALCQPLTFFFLLYPIPLSQWLFLSCHISLISQAVLSRTQDTLACSCRREVKAVTAAGAAADEPPWLHLTLDCSESAHVPLPWASLFLHPA